MKMADFKEHAMQFSPVQSCFSNLYNSSPRMKSVEHFISYKIDCQLKFAGFVGFPRKYW